MKLACIIFFVFSIYSLSNATSLVSIDVVDTCQHTKTDKFDFQIAHGERRKVDSIPYAKIIIYRPDNQMKRKYSLITPGHSKFKLGRKEAKTFDVYVGYFNVTVYAFGYDSKNYTFALSKDKLHYFRIQDRANHTGWLAFAFLEVIEVTEGTYKNDLNEAQ